MGKKPLRGPRKSSGGFAGFKETRMIWVLVFILAILAAAGTLYILSGLTKQDTYYVLNTNMPSRTQITSADLQPVTTSQGSAPQNAIGLDVINQGSTYTKYPLQAGDVVSASNAGSLDTINEGIPDNWVVTSFNPGGDDPIIENLQRGDHFDMMITNAKQKDQQSNPDDSDMSNIAIGQYAFRNVMVLDNPMSTTANANNDSANGATAQTQNSTQMFIVGMSPKNAAMLTYITGNYATKIVMSPKQTSYEDPSSLNKLYETFNFNDYLGEHSTGIMPSNCVDSATGEEINEDCTDNTFAPQERDEFGVPYNASASERDSNGDPMPLTEFELQWCEQLFTNDYYSGRTSNKWDEEKQYCVNHTPKNPKSEQNFKKLYDEQQKQLNEEKAKNTASKLGNTSGADSDLQSGSSRTGTSSSKGSDTASGSLDSGSEDDGLSADSD